jgi:protein O-GlcNAc transferase
MSASQPDARAAVSAYRSALAQGGPQFELLFGLASAQQASGDAFGAIETYRQCLRLRPNAAEIHNNLGTVLDRIGNVEQAIACFRESLRLKPDYVRALNNLGKALRQAGQTAEAVDVLQRALALAPRNAITLTNFGFALVQLKRAAEAERRLRRAIALAPQLAEAHHGLGEALLARGDTRGAVAQFERSLALKPDLLEARLQWGRVLLGECCYAEALQIFQQALQHHPYSAEANLCCGLARAEAGYPEAALPSYDSAVALDPGHAGAHLSRARALAAVQRFPDALEEFRRAAALRPEGTEATVEELHALAKICDWPASRAAWEKLRHLTTDTEAFQSFAYLSLRDDPAGLLRSCREYAMTIIQKRAPLVPVPRYEHTRIRLAYLSRDYFAHATAYLISELFELHDRQAFRIYGVSYGPDDGSPMRRRIAAACECFVDVADKSDQEIANWLRAEEIDIAVDLKGYTAFGRSGILAYRPAPVQVSYLGFPGSMGAPFIDYLIADEVVIPEAERPFYQEKIAYLPGCYQVNDRKRRVAERTPERAAVGLPARGFVFCCFNNNWKITEAVFEVWMRLLKAVEGSVLWLLKDNPWAEENLRREAVARGVAAERLVFAGRTGNEEHLARHRLADLFLDTLPVNAHTTASDALWVGLPIVTCAGRGFAARVAGSLLRAVGLGELVASTLEEYEGLALALAREPQRLGVLRGRLLAQRESAALFDTPRFCRHLEAAYRRMWLTHREGRSPETFKVAPLGGTVEPPT